MLSQYPRFRYSTISFNLLRDKIPKILRYFDSEECLDLPLTDICSRYFWQTVPQSSHNFDTIKAVNHDEGDESEDLDSESSEEEEGPMRQMMSQEEFRRATHFYIFKRGELPRHNCPICRADFIDEDRISVLICHHQFHTGCVRPWLTSRNSTCPTCRDGTRGTLLRNLSMTIDPHTPVTDDDMDNLSNSTSSINLDQS